MEKRTQTECTEIVVRQAHNQNVELKLNLHTEDVDETAVPAVLDLIRADKERNPLLANRLKHDDDFLERYLNTVIDPVLFSLALGRAIPSATGDALNDTFIETQAIRSLRAHFPELSMADAEILAEKACQKIIARVMRKPKLLRDLADPAKLGAYVRTTIRNLFFDRTKNPAFIVPLEPELLEIPLVNPEPIDRRRSTLDHAIQHAGLTATERRRINMVLQNLANTEIALIEGCSEAAVRKSVKAARKKIGNWLDDSGQTPHTTA